MSIVKKWKTPNGEILVGAPSDAAIIDSQGNSWATHTLEEYHGDADGGTIVSGSGSNEPAGHEGSDGDAGGVGQGS